MDPREMLAKLTTHGPRLDGGSRSTGTDGLTAAEIGFAMGLGLSKLEGRLLLAKFCGDDLELYLLERDLGQWLRHRKWFKSDLEQFVDALATAAVGEHCGSNRCSQCDGIGEVHNDALRVSCEACHGTGHQYPGENDYATALGVTIGAYRNTWGSRVEATRAELRRLEYSAFLRFAEALG